MTLCCALPAQALAQETVLIPNRVIYPGETVAAA
jgi:flagella basal body P-ring formation protein FlgA